MRNSWGDNWGEDGYMRMPYGCASIGYGAAYVDYYGGAYLLADTCVGWTPFDVQFSGMSGLEVDQWTWDFGDGDSAFVQNPIHLYDSPGLFDVTVQVVADGDVRSRTRVGYIAALADTMWIDQQEIDQSADTFDVVVYAINNSPIREFRVPVEYAGTLNLVYDTFSTEGCRTDYFEIREQMAWAPSKLMTFRLVSSPHDTEPELAPGGGPILRIRFHTQGVPSIGQQTPLVIDGYSTSYVPEFAGSMAEYRPVTIDGLVACSGCCHGLTGNINGDPDDRIDVSDLVFLVDYMFSGGDQPPCSAEASVDGDLFQHIDITDLVYLVSYMFSGGPAPIHCF
jgi:PKD repeat protein